VSQYSLGVATLGTEVDLGGLNSGLNEAKNNSEKGFLNVGNVVETALGVGVANAAGAALGAIKDFTIQGVNSFIDFQGSMNEAFTLLPGISDSAMAEMSGQVKDFATEFGRLPNEVVPALYQSLSAGVPPDNVFDFMAVAQKAAVGGVTELETAVDGITSVVNAYGSEVVDATQASDLMFTAVKLGKTDFGQLSASLFNVIPTASALGVNFGDVTAALAAMTAQGTPTSVATTQMRQMLVELSKEGGKTSDTFKKIAGQSFKEFVASGGNVQDALQLLEQHAGTTGVGINDLFGSVEAGNAALALTGGGTEMFANALAEMEGAAGATDAAYQQMEQGVGRSLDRIKAAGQVALLEIGDRFAPVLASIAELVVAHLPRAMEMFTGWMDAAGQAVQPLISAISTLAPHFGTFFEILSGNAPKMTDITSAFTALMGVFGIETTTRILEVMNVIQRLVRAFREDGLQGAVQKLLPVLQNVFQGILSYVQGQLPAWQAQLMAWGAALWQWLVNTVPELHARWTTLRAQLIGWVLETGVALAGQLLTWGQALWAWIGPQIPVLIAKAQELAGQFLAWVSAQAAPILARFHTWKDAFIAWVVPAVTEFLGKWPGMFDRFLRLIEEQAGPILAKLGSWTSSFLAWVVEMLPGFLTAVAGIAAALFVWIVQTGDVLQKRLVQVWIPAFLDWIKSDLVPKLSPALGKVWDEIKLWIGKAADWVKDEAKKIGDAILKGIGAGIDAANTWLKGKIEAIAGLLPQWLKDRLGIASPSKVMIEQVGEPMGEGIVVGLQRALTGGWGTMDKLISTFILDLGSTISGDEVNFDGFSRALRTLGMDPWAAQGIAETLVDHFLSMPQSAINVAAQGLGGSMGSNLLPALAGANINIHVYPQSGDGYGMGREVGRGLLDELRAEGL
jgi:TP901 family phage tail tape measure protein